MEFKFSDGLELPAEQVFLWLQQGESLLFVPFVDDDKEDDIEEEEIDLRLISRTSIPHIMEINP
jgi:hypothetical protein